MTFESFSAPRTREPADPSPRGEAAAEVPADERYRLREGNLLEDFGTAIAADDAAATLAATSIESGQGETDGATALWLVGVLAGGLAGAAWLNRGGQGATAPPDANPCPIPAD